MIPFLTSRRGRLIGLLTPGLLVGIVLGVAGWGSFNTVMEATNSLDFCISCHEMRDNVYKEYVTSVHYSNASGVRAICSDCHVPKDWTHKIVRKAQASQELLYKLTGSIDTPEKFAARRLDLARHEWARMRESDSRECRNCHSFEAMDFHKQRPKAAAQMEKAAQGGFTCIDCHKGIAHRMPDLTARYTAMRAALAPPVAPASGAVVIAHRLAPFFLAPPSGGEGEAGTIAPLARLTIGGVKGDMIEVELTGWQRAGYEEQIVAGQGLRILVATLDSEAAMKAVAPVDPGALLDDEHEWRQVRLAVWISREAVTQDEKALNAYGDEIYEASCALCHVLHRPEAFAANDWIGKMNAMKRFTPLGESDYALLLAHVQQKAAARR